MRYENKVLVLTASTIFIIVRNSDATKRQSSFFSLKKIHWIRLRSLLLLLYYEHYFFIIAINIIFISILKSSMILAISWIALFFARNCIFSQSMRQLYRVLNVYHKANFPLPKIHPGWNRNKENRFFFFATHNLLWRFLNLTLS